MDYANKQKENLFYSLLEQGYISRGKEDKNKEELDINQETNTYLKNIKQKIGLLPSNNRYRDTNQLNNEQKQIFYEITNCIDSLSKIERPKQNKTCIIL